MIMARAFFAVLLLWSITCTTASKLNGDICANSTIATPGCNGDNTNQRDCCPSNSPGCNLCQSSFCDAGGRCSMMPRQVDGYLCAQPAPRGCGASCKKHCGVCETDYCGRDGKCAKMGSCGPPSGGGGGPHEFMLHRRRTPRRGNLTCTLAPLPTTPANVESSSPALVSSAMALDQNAFAGEMGDLALAFSTIGLSFTMFQAVYKFHSRWCLFSAYT